jgi:FkbM family methyltransferase
MQKLFNLYRLEPANRLPEVRYLLKRVLGRNVSAAERLLNEYYFHLIKHNGIQKGESDQFYISYYVGLGVTARLRKKPSSDMDVFGQIFGFEEYKPVVASYREHFGNIDTLNIIDAGANIGLTSVYFSRFFNAPNIVCVEPEQANFNALEFNLEANGITANNVRGGLWHKNTRLKIVSDFRDRNDWAFRVVETDDADALEAYTIPHLMEEYRMPIIDILKIDIEGSEKEIFGADADVSFLSHVRCIAIEIHDEFNCREQVDAVLKKYNFACYESGELTIGINNDWANPAKTNS